MVDFSSSMFSPVWAEKHMRPLPVFMMSLLLSATMIGTPWNPSSMFLRSFSWTSLPNPQVSDGSTTNSMTSVRYLRARTACFSMSFLSSKVLSRSPGVSTTWYFLHSSCMWPTMIPLVVKG